MFRTVAAAIFLMCMAAPAWANEKESFDPDQPFEQALTTDLLRSLLNQALDQFEDYVEIAGKIDPDDARGDRRGHLRFKFYPEGRSKSDQHLTAEGWFQFSPESGKHDWHFKFKLPEDHSTKSSLLFQTPLSLKKVYSYLCSVSFAEQAVKFSSLRTTPSRRSQKPA